jgi:flagella basal body P-ring formation protein FlgA
MRGIIAALAFLVFAAPALAQSNQPFPLVGEGAARSAPGEEKEAPSPVLKRAVTVASDLVRIGDLIENAEGVANIPVFRSPDLGQTGTVQARRVIEAVAPHGVVLAETNAVAEVLVTRTSRTITAQDVETRIARELAARRLIGGTDDLVIAFDRAVRTFHVEPTVTAELAVTRLNYDARQGRFEASFELPGSAVARKLPLHFSGRAVETGEVLVLARPLARGETVRAADLAIERRPRPEVPADALTHPDAVLGMAARHVLRTGQVLRAADLAKPLLVQRNEPVTIVYEVPGIVLTVRGKAIEAGAQGDLVTVLNVQSKRNVQGFVSGPGRVSVPSAAPALTASVSPRLGAVSSATAAAAAQTSE